MRLILIMIPSLLILTIASPPLHSAPINKKQTKLEFARHQLKKDFVGNDSQIDQILGHIKNWYIAPHHLRRPTVVNLWGMTGTGKSAFIRKLVEYLELDKAFAEVNMSSFSDNRESTFLERTRKLAGKHSVIYIDEWHLGRTIDSLGDEIRPLPSSYQEIFSLMSDGKIVEEINLTEVREMYQLFTDIIKSPTEWEIADHAWGTIETLFQREGKTYTELQYEFFSDKIEFCKRGLKYTEKAGSQTVHNFENSLVFVSGNLDSAFGGSDVLDKDFITANEMREFSQRVSFQDIQEALSKRFRREQLGRLGNNHVIFWSLDEKGFRDLIKKELNIISRQTQQKSGVNIRFGEDVIDLIYKEGVIPALGTRPLFSTIQTIIESRIPDWLTKAERISARSRRKVRYIKVTADLSTFTLVARGYENGRSQKNSLFKLALQVPSQIEKNRVTPLPEPKHTRVSVHEAGHAHIGIIRGEEVPLRAAAKSSNPGTGGFVRYSEHYDLETKKSISLDIARTLGGYAAELIVFGPENLSSGAQQDLRIATRMASMMVREYAMGENIAISTYDSTVPDQVHSEKRNEQAEAEVEKILREALESAKAAILEQQPLFKALVENLRQRLHLNQEDMKIITAENIIDTGGLKARVLNPQKLECLNLWDNFLKGKTPMNNNAFGLTQPRMSLSEK